MSRFVFRLNTDNSVEIMDSDFIEQTISIQVDGDVLKFKESSLLALYLYNFFNFLGLKVNITMLSLIAIFFITFRQLLNFFNLVLIQKVCSRIHKKLNPIR